MSTQLIKVAEDRDLYVEWDMVGSEPVWIGNRADTKEYLLDATAHSHRYTDTDAEQRLHRADKRGTSSYGAGCDWESGGIVYYQSWLPRRNIGILADRLLAAPGWTVDYEDLVEDTN